MKKVLLITLNLLFLTSCVLFDPTYVVQAKKGYADYYLERIDMDEVLKRPRELKKIGNHELLLPHKTTFKYGSTRHRKDEIFGKKRRYFYDESKGLGEEIYLIDDTMEYISKTPDGVFLKYSTNKAGRAIHGRREQVLIPIKKDLYISCRLHYKATEANESYPECEIGVDLLKKGM